MTKRAWIRLLAPLVVAWLVGVVVWIEVGAVAGLIVVFAGVAIAFGSPLQRGLRVTKHVNARTGSQGSGQPSWTADKVRPRSYIVQQPDPRFEAQARRLFGPLYLLQIVDKTTGKEIPRAARSVPLSGRSSVNRAVKFGILRFYAEHPDQR
jgi:hypothetical protein